MIQINASGLSWGDCQWLHHFLYYYAGLPEDAFFGKETITLRGLLDAQTHRQVEALLTEKKIPFTAGEDSPSAPQAQSSPEGAPASARVLPITGAKQITLFQNHALLMQIPLCSEAVLPWYYCNFINICYYKNHWFDYTDYINFYEKVCHFTRITYDAFFDFNNEKTFTAAIDHNYYVYLWVNKRCLPGTEAYEKKEDIHPILIYGYDRRKESYCCAHFEINQGVLYTEMPAAAVHKAFESARLHGMGLTDRPVAYVLKPHLHCGTYNYFWPRFLQELHHYLTGRGRADELYFSIRNPPDYAYLYFGLDVTEELIKGLKNHERTAFDYRLFHMVTENKKLLLERLEYANENKCGGRLGAEIAAFRRLVGEYEAIRARYIRYALLETNMRTFYPPPRSPEAVEKLCAMIRTAAGRERALLTRLYTGCLLYLSSEREFGYANLIDHTAFRGILENGRLRYAIQFTPETAFDYIRISAFHRDIRGTAAIGFPTPVCEKIEDGRDLIFETPDMKVKEISFELNRFSVDEQNPPLCVYACRSNLRGLLEKAECSSIYSGRTDLTFLPENTLSFDKNTFWCPEPEDRARFIRYTLKEAAAFERLVILQHYGAVRVRRFRVDYSMDGTCWHTAAAVESDIGNTVFTQTFPKIRARFVKLIIEATAADGTGYDMPNICFFDIC